VRIVVAAALALLAAGCGTRQAEEPRQAEERPPAAIPSLDESTGTDAEPCPESGLLLRPGGSDAAMGLRALSFTLSNCGDTPQKLDGHPDLALYDADGRPIQVSVRHGPAGIARVDSFDRPARPSPPAPCP